MTHIEKYTLKLEPKRKDNFTHPVVQFRILVLYFVFLLKSYRLTFILFVYVTSCLIYRALKTDYEDSCESFHNAVPFSPIQPLDHTHLMKYIDIKPGFLSQYK